MKLHNKNAELTISPPEKKGEVITTSSIHGVFFMSIHKSIDLVAPTDAD